MSPTSTASEVGWWATVAGLGTATLTFIFALVRVVRKVESMDNKIQSHEQALRDVLKLFSDQDGNPRFVTVLVCDRKATQCGVLSGEKFSHMGERITALVLEVTALRKDMRDTQDATLEAILKAIKEK